MDEFAELANMDAAGRDLGPRLAQLNLTTTEYRFLAGIRELAQGNATVSSDMREAVDAVLVLVEKRLAFAEWRIDEQAAEITLDPNRFVVQKYAKPADDSPQLRWLHDPIALQQWVDTLKARRSAQGCEGGTQSGREQRRRSGTAAAAQYSDHADRR